jgi:hypothetical protein
MAGPSNQSDAGGQPGASGGGPSDPTGETEAERLQRNFAELLQELRVAQTGVQILFAFLLTIAFTGGFRSAGTFAHTVYLVALLSAAAAAAMIIAPVAYHRVMFRLGQKSKIVRSAHRLAYGGLMLLLVAMVASVLLATDTILERPAAIAVSVVAGIWFLLLWAVLPLRRRHDGDDE